MKGKSIQITCFSFIIFLCGVAWGPVAGYAELVDRIVAIVNDDCIALSELNEALKPYLEQIRGADYPPARERELIFRLRQDMLDKMIDQKLAEQETQRLNLQVEDKEIDQHIEQIKSQHFLTDEELRESLAAEGYTLEEYRKRMQDQLLQMKLINLEVKSKIAITDKDIQGYYVAHKADYQGVEKYHLRTILIELPPSASADQKRAALEKVVAVLRAFESGADFGELARQHSEDGTAAQGGDLGLFTLDELSAEFRSAVVSMAEGQVSPVLETPKGYQLLMLEEIKKTPAKTLKEVSIEIHEKLFQEFVEEKYSAWLKGLRDRSYVKVIL